MVQISSRAARTAIFALLTIGALHVSGCASQEDRARAYYESGMKLLAQKDAARASIEFRNAVKLKRDLVEAWRELAQIEEGNRRWDAVIPILRTLVELQPADVSTKLKLARLLILAGSTEEALKLVNAAGDIDARNGEVLAVKALVLFKLNDVAGATREARSALEVDPTNPGAIVILAAESLSRGDTKAALQILDRDPVAHEKDLGIQLFKLKILEQTQDLKQAELVLLKLADLYPDQPEFRRELIKLYVYQHRSEEAEKEQRAFVSAHPKDLNAALELVGLLFAIKGADAARHELVSRIDSGGDVFPFQITLAEFDFRQGNVDESSRLLEKLISDKSSPDHVLVAQIKLAQMHLVRKKPDSAEALVSDVLDKDARNIDGLKLRASIRLDRGQLEPAINDLRRALNDQPQSAELMVLLAVAYERSGSIELAEKQFAEATRVSGFDAKVGLDYLAFLQRRGNAARAEDVAAELASRRPNSVEILSALAQIRLARQNWIGAQEVAETIRRIGDQRGMADQILGAALIGRSKYDESIAVLKNAYAAAPAAAQPMFSLVRAYVAAQQTDRAVGFLESVLKANPANAEALVLMGSIQLRTNLPTQAQKNFETAIQKQPRDIIGYRALADFYVNQNKLEEALRTVRTGLREQPDSSVLRLYLAGILERKGYYEAAISEYELMLQKDPGSLIAANNLASLLVDRRIDKASFERAQSLAVVLRKSPVPQFKDTLGWVNYQVGEFKAAVPLLEEAVAGLPNQPLINYHLGMTYIAVGQTEKALEQLKTALNYANEGELKEKIQAALRKVGA
jgi:tetratricopeptide (TPR) repeat protein